MSRDIVEQKVTVLSIIRRIRKLTQDELARIVGISQPKISQLERGLPEGRISAETLVRLSEALGWKGRPEELLEEASKVLKY